MCADTIRIGTLPLWIDQFAKNLAVRSVAHRLLLITLCSVILFHFMALFPAYDVGHVVEAEAKAVTEAIHAAVLPAGIARTVDVAIVIDVKNAIIIAIVTDTNMFLLFFWKIWRQSHALNKILLFEYVCFFLPVPLWCHLLEEKKNIWKHSYYPLHTHVFFFHWKPINIISTLIALPTNWFLQG